MPPQTIPDRFWNIGGVNVGFLKREAEDFIVKSTPGYRDMICRPVQTWDLDNPEIRSAYDAFLGHGDGPPQTPLRALGIGDGEIAGLEAVGVESVEALAVLHDGAGVRNGQSLKRKAADYLAKASKENFISRATWAELRRLEGMIEELGKRLDGQG